MVIMSIAERSKKQTQQISALAAEKEDLGARLQVGGWMDVLVFMLIVTKSG